MEKNYFFIDGSALLAQIRALQKKKVKFQNRKLNPLSFINYFAFSLSELSASSYKRAVFYFPIGEDKINEYLVKTDFKSDRSAARDINFKFCGFKLKKTEAYNRWLATEVPERYKQYCTKSEKGIDIEICCDALQLASMDRMERLFILTNDSDFVPLFETLKTLGVNVSLLQLSDHNNKNKLLKEAADTFDTIPESSLDGMFETVTVETVQDIQVVPIPETVTGEVPTSSTTINPE
jgi:uncharacterized LabA/DUF88 family protein